MWHKRGFNFPLFLVSVYGEEARGTYGTSVQYAVTRVYTHTTHPHSESEENPGNLAGREVDLISLSVCPAGEECYYPGHCCRGATWHFVYCVQSG